ncbi:MAG: transglycosylase family protein [Enhydrobacter sp.]|nr:transglycosylase family protein [Enhydrobacter sp.]
MLLLPGGALAGGPLPHPAPAPDPAGEARSITREVRQDALLRKLADCETGGRGEAGVGRGPYIGVFQFAPSTVINFVRERDGRTLSAQEAMALARDYRRAAALVKYVIFDRGGHTHWPACSRKLGIPGQAAAIKAL